MKRQTSKPGAIAIVLLSGVAWLAISNHCVLGALEGKKNVDTHAACHGNAPAPGKLPSKGEQSPCCKVLRATVAKDALAVSGLIKFTLTDYPRVVETIWSDSLLHGGMANELDNGPPFASSFAELILQGSLFAHAPPFFV